MRSILIACCLLLIVAARADSGEQESAAEAGCTFGDVLMMSDAFLKNASVIDLQKQRIEELENKVKSLSTSKCTCL